MPENNFIVNPMVTISIIGEHARRNATTWGRWDAMTSHRARVMQLIEEARGEHGETLCVLGPGNGNDVELARLAREFEKIALVDLDEAAIARAVGRLDENSFSRVERFSPVDLSGILPVLESWVRHRNPADAEFTAVMRTAMAAPRPEVGSFDVVASTCMLTQLIDSIYMALPTEHSRCVELVMAVRNRHLEIILELLNPGGVGVLVTDFVATETAPELAQLDELLLPRAATKWIEERNFFTGANPFAIRDYYNRSRGPGPCASDAQVKGPWRWDIGAKQLAVCAVTFRRRP
jgi:SAM-dependent methyltransferase